MKLLNPGPVSLTKRVRDALSRTDLCHREIECSRLIQSVSEKILRVYPSHAEHYSAVLISGSGTAAVEAMVGTLVPRDGTALVIANGVYGERMAAMLKAQGKQFDVFDTEWDVEISLEKLDACLSAKTYSAALVVHHETTSARLNDLKEISAKCKHYQTPVLVDAVSSFGAEHIDLQAWNIDACAATANKCLHGAPGIAFVVARNDRLQQVSAATSVYLDLNRLYQEQQKGSTAFTPAVHVLFALEEALMELEEAGGAMARQAHYLKLSQELRLGFERLGFVPLLKDRHYASYFTSFLLPKTLRYPQLHDQLKAHGFIVYAGQGKFQHEIVRISTMGDLTLEDVQRLYSVTENIVQGSAV